MFLAMRPVIVRLEWQRRKSPRLMEIKKIIFFRYLNGAPERIRTSDPQIRSLRGLGNIRNHREP